MKGVSRFAQFLLLGVVLLTAACGVPSTDSIREEKEPATSSSGSEVERETVKRNYDEYRIVTLLPRDAIPAIDNPEFLTVEEADKEYDPDELVLGVVFNGEARAYSISLLSSHEIVNDTVGGVKIAVTW